MATSPAARPKLGPATGPALSFPCTQNPMRSSLKPADSPESCATFLLPLCVLSPMLLLTLCTSSSSSNPTRFPPLPRTLLPHPLQAKHSSDLRPQHKRNFRGLFTEGQCRNSALLSRCVFLAPLALSACLYLYISQYPGDS